MLLKHAMTHNPREVRFINSVNEAGDRAKRLTLTHTNQPTNQPPTMRTTASSAPTLLSVLVVVAHVWSGWCSTDVGTPRGGRTTSGTITGTMATGAVTHPSLPERSSAGGRLSRITASTTDNHFHDEDGRVRIFHGFNRVSAILSPS